MKVNAIQCSKCGDTIFSRARHDCRACTCGGLYIDGGFEYTRVGYKEAFPKILKINVKATRKELYNDWNNAIDKFGLIKEK